MKFAHENLEVWHRAVDFAVQVIDTVERIETGRKHYRLMEQIEACSTSISMNLAEGKGRNSKKGIHPILLHCERFSLRDHNPV